MRSALGSVQKKGENYWLVSITIGVDAKTGKQVRKSKRVRGSERDAERTLMQLLAEYDQSPSEGMEVTFRDYVEAVYLPRILKEVEKREAGKRGKYKRRTYEEYAGRLRRHVIPYIGDKRLRSIKPKDIKAMLSHAGTDATVREARKMVSFVFKEAIYDEYCESNPVDSVRAPMPSDYEPELLDTEDIEVYLWHFRDTRAEPIVLLAIGGSYRRGEIAALNVEDIDFRCGKVTISSEYIHTKTMGDIYDTPKNDKPRTNFLPMSIANRLAKILPASGPILTNPKTGERIKPDSVSQLYERVRDKLPEGVPRISLKNLRHSSLSLVFDATGSMESARGHAGHGTEAVTRKHYVRAHDLQEMKTAAAMDDLLNGGKPTV